MIRRAAENISNSTGEKMNVSLREFPQNGSTASRVELVHYYILKIWDLLQFLQQAANISIKINTTKEFVTDQDQDTDKTDVRAHSRSFFSSATSQLLSSKYHWCRVVIILFLHQNDNFNS